MSATPKSSNPKTDFAELRGILAHLPPSDLSAASQSLEFARRHRYDATACDVALWMAAWQRRSVVKCDHPRVATFAGAVMPANEPENLNAAKQWMQSASNGGDWQQYWCAALDCDWRIYDMGLDFPALLPPARPVDESTIAEAVAYGMMAVEQGIDILILQLAGAGHDIAAEWMLRQPKSDPFELLMHLGSRDVAGLYGAMIAARMARVPVLVDGFHVAALLSGLAHFAPGILDHGMAVVGDESQSQILSAIFKNRLIVDQHPQPAMAQLPLCRAIAAHQSA